MTTVLFLGLFGFLQYCSLEFFFSLLLNHPVRQAARGRLSTDVVVCRGNTASTIQRSKSNLLLTY